MLEVTIKTIPHESHRYKTVGDYTFDKKRIDILVSKMRRRDYEFLVALHEFIEAYLCIKNGIKEKDITKFDIQFEKKRPKGYTEEPGNHIDAPYHNEHLYATMIEKMLADELDVDWDLYEKELNNLSM